MHLELTEEQTMMRDTCRSFAREERVPKAAEIDETREFPEEQVAKMVCGMLGITSAPPDDETDALAIAIGAPSRRDCVDAVLSFGITRRGS